LPPPQAPPLWRGGHLFSTPHPLGAFDASTEALDCGPPTSTPGSAYVRVGGRLARGAEGGWTPLVLTLKRNLGLIKKSQSRSRDVIGLYRVSVAASFSFSHVVSRRGLTVTRCVLRLTVNSLELTEHDNHSSFKTRRNNDWSGSSNFSKPAVNNLSGFRILELWRRLSQTHRPLPCYDSKDSCS